MTDEKKKAAVEKRKATLAKKARTEQLSDEYGKIAQSALTAFGGDEEQKIQMLKTIHLSVLGLDKDGNARPFSDLRLFMMQANQRKLDPFKKQIHAVYLWDSSRKAEILTPITGIDGFRSIAQRAQRPLYAGSSETEFEYTNPDDKYPKLARTHVYAYNPVTGAREVITTGVAIWDEYVKMVDEKVWKDGKQVKTGNKVPNSTWDKMPTVMLGKCSEALALRKAFPDDLGGLYVAEELDHAQREVDDEPEADDDRKARIDEKVRNFGKSEQAQEGEVVDDKK